MPTEHLYNCDLPSLRVFKGTRYIPKFADPLGWNEETEYEELTVVYWCGRTYISKQEVPAGSPLPEFPEIQNDYWALYADYNAQLEHYRQEVRSFSTRYDKMYCFLKAWLEREEAERKEADRLINIRIDNLQNQVNEFYQEFKQFEEHFNSFEQTVNNFIEETNTWIENAGSSFGDIIYGSSVDDEGNITIPEGTKVPIGNINVFSGDASHYIRTRGGEVDDDIKAV